jgi:hypothetical protein
MCLAFVRQYILKGINYANLSVLEGIALQIIVALAIMVVLYYPMKYAEMKLPFMIGKKSSKI